MHRLVAEMRRRGIPVSMVEALDAAAALEHTDLTDREAVRNSLAATLVKASPDLEAFDELFALFFAATAGVGLDLVRELGDVTPEDPDGIRQAILAAIAGGDGDALRRAAVRAVMQLAGMEPGRPVGGTYYLFRVENRLELDRLEADHPEFAQLFAEFRRLVRDEIVRRLVADRGPEAVARSLTRPRVEDMDLVTASPRDLDKIEHALRPLGRKLASRLAQQRLHARPGRLDVRTTVRRSLSYGGALAEPRFRKPRISKPHITLLCDMSGSVASFARFTLQLIYAMSSEFERVRAFGFVDGVDEITSYFGPGIDFADAVRAITLNARLVEFDGHSDYGGVLGRFTDEYLAGLDRRTNLVITGDGRSNYRAPRPELLEEISRRVRAVYWLNPEPRRYWDTGDSVISSYRPHIRGLYEVRNLRQLEAFVEALGQAVFMHRAEVKLG